tara:strand:- start:977 stop:1945 length:969 start_codon:yes stop_codon:yes gene_type:complete
MNKDIQIAKKTVQTSINALKKLSSSFNRSLQFSKAVNLMCKTKSKVCVVGVGKSFLIGSRVASTLSSLGIPSVAFSANELSHGGLGFFSKEDIILIFSASGESSELNDVIRHAHRFDIKIIGVSCKSNSMLLKNSTIKILLPKVIEPVQTLAPISTTTMFGCLGDSLAIACSKRKKWTNKKFVSHHPSGTLATALIQVKEIMSKKIPIINSNKTMKSAVAEMTKKKLGMICIKSPKGIHVITDGDLRRFSNNLFRKKIMQVATKNPAWISEEATALSAIEKMTQLKISSLLVTRSTYINKKNSKIPIVGVLTMLHCLSRGIK